MSIPVRTCLLFVLVVPISYCQLTFYLPSDKVSEGPCSKPSPAVASNINTRWLNQPRKYYISFGNKAMVRRYAETFLARPAKSVDELDTLCLQVYITGKNVSTYAYGNQSVEQSCPSKQTGVFNCFGKSGSPGTNLTALDTSVETVVYTDNKSSVLVVRCINDEIRDYKLLSTSPNPEGKVIAEVKAKITQLGFTTLYSTKLTCDGEYTLK